MAYQPKYARKPQAPAPQPQGQKKAPPRPSRGQRLLSAVLGVLLIPASVFAGVLLLRQMLTTVGRPKVSGIRFCRGSAAAADAHHCGTAQGVRPGSDGKFQPPGGF